MRRTRQSRRSSTLICYPVRHQSGRNDIGVGVATGRSKVSAENAFRTAEAFSEASEGLHKSGREGNDKLLVLVFATLASFQLEMYLKCLLLVEQGLHREGHDVLKLFRCLSDKTQAELTAAHDEYQSDFPPALAELKRRNIPSDLITLLDRGRRAFMDFRYAHENKGNSFWALTGLTRLIRERILRLRPEWKDILSQVSSQAPLYSASAQSTSRTGSSRFANQ